MCAFVRRAVAACAVLLSLLPISALGREPAGASNLANYQVATFTTALADSVEMKLNQIINLAPSIQQILNTSDDQQTIHKSLKKLIAGFPHGRALFLVDPAGIMRVHSSEYPAPMLELSDRTYFRSVVADDGPTATVGSLLINRMSQQPFIPVSARVRMGSANWAAVADVNPDTLIAGQFRCPRCVAWLLTPDGSVLASAPPGQNPPYSLLEHIRSARNGTPTEIYVGMIKSVFNWTGILGGQIIVVHLMEM